MEKNFQEAVLNEIRLALTPLINAARREEERSRLFGALGWDLNALKGLDIDALVTAFSTIYGSIESLLENPLEELSDFIHALEAVRTAFDAISKLATTVQGTDQLPAEFAEIGRDLVEFLFVDYLWQNHPTAYYTLVLLTLIRDPQDIGAGNISSPVIKDGTLIRYPVVVPKLHLDNTGRVLSDPIGYLKKEYFPNSLATSGDASQAADRLFPRLARFLQALGVEATYGISPDYMTLYEYDWGTFGNSAISKMLTLLLRLDRFAMSQGSDGNLGTGADLELGATLALASAEQGNLGLVVQPFGNLTLTLPLNTWLLVLKLIAPTTGFAIGKQGFIPLIDNNSTSASGQLTLLKLPPENGDPAILIGSTKGTHLEISSFQITSMLDVDSGQIDWEMLLEIASSALVITAGDGDGFLQKVLPRDGVRTDFDLAIGWSKRKGLYFRGSAGLEATLPVHVSLLDALTVDSVYLALHTKDAAVETAIALTASIKLGPFSGNVERMGLLAAFTFPPDGGNLGPVNVRLGFKPPSGAGMAIDASAVVGGGYLFFDPDNEQYAGILQLEIQKIVSLKAIGLLTTRMPDGSKGFSLLVIISAEFPPIQLGFGFTLTGVGGLLGVNRTMVVDVLRSGLRNGTLGSILFPQNPVEHAQKIISDLRSIFPVAPMRFVFGPVARLGWGTNNLIIAELGILLELPQPIRLVILGRLTLALPNEKSPVVLIHLDSLGVIDFDRGDVSLDATIYDSKIAMFALTGDMALRLNWGLSPSFAVAVGGFNPRFQPPPNFPQLNRLAISLATSDNPRIRLETYLALTANTFQFGARLDFNVEVSVKVIGTFSASAYLGFDALVQMAPLQFIVDIDGGVAIKHNGHPLFSASLHLSLSGPEPVHAWGEATFAFLGERRIPFDLTLSAGMIQPPLLPADPLQKLIEELEAKANWSAQLPRDENMLVTLRKIEVVDEILAHPLGELTVGQKAVPLEVMITRFGNTSPTRSGPFRITFVQMGDQVSDQPRQTLRALYTPGQFFEMSDEEKLARPAFEALPSGCSRIGTTAIRHSATQVKAIAQYDTVVVDKLEQRQKRTDAAFAYTIPSAVQAALAGLGAAGQSAMRATGSAKYVGSDQQQVKLADPAYVVTSTDDMNWQKTDKKPTYTEAEAVRQQKGAPNGRYQVVGAHEVR
jgi:hypothetical protein